jgi:hypothetical protein
MLLSGPGGGSAWAQDVLTERYDNARTGAISQPINASTIRQGWHKLGLMQVTGRVYAQPLFVGGLSFAKKIGYLLLPVPDVTDSKSRAFLMILFRSILD